MWRVDECHHVSRRHSLARSRWRSVLIGWLAGLLEFNLQCNVDGGIFCLVPPQLGARSETPFRPLYVNVKSSNRPFRKTLDSRNSLLFEPLRTR